LEITESVLVRDIDGTIRQLEALKRLGVGIGIDDFGTGYSSLEHLRRFPVDVLKIDQAFVDGVAGGSEEASFAGAIITLAEQLHLRTIAEGASRPRSRRRPWHRSALTRRRGTYSRKPFPSTRWTNSSRARPAGTTGRPGTRYLRSWSSPLFSFQPDTEGRRR
jgi:EAL domain-containing protein (putative c-di-GMP-specific phosphodiesterase class I)